MNITEWNNSLEYTKKAVTNLNKKMNQLKELILIELAIKKDKLKMKNQSSDYNEWNMVKLILNLVKKGKTQVIYLHTVRLNYFSRCSGGLLT